MSEDIVGPRGKRVLYSKFFAGGIHESDLKHLREFKRNCFTKGIHMNYDGKKRGCGWSILFKRNNKIEKTLVPIAMESGIDIDVFIDEMIDRLLEDLKTECAKNKLAKEVGTFRKDEIKKVVSNITIT